MTTRRWFHSLCLMVAVTGIIAFEDVSGMTEYQSSSTSPSTNTSISVRLADGTNTEGRLEVFYNGEWGTVCDDNFDSNDAVVACRMLGFSGPSMSLGNQYGAGNGTIWLDDLGCQGWEASLTSCYHPGFGIHNCGHSEDVSIRCNAEDQTVSSPWTTPASIAVRLADGTDTEGRLEVFYNGVWGTVCDDNFDSNDAVVACRMLGFSGPAASLGNQYGTGTGTIWLDDLGCQGWEASLTSCYHPGFGIHNCGHSEDVSITCNTFSKCNATFAACDAILRSDVRTTFTYITNGFISPDDVAAYCSNWTTCTQVANTSGCSLNDVYLQLSYWNYWYYGNYHYNWYNSNFNRSVGSMNLICNNVTRDYPSYYSCTAKHGYANVTTRCDMIRSAKQQSPYYIYTDSCTYYRDHAKCVFKALNGTCGTNIALNFAMYDHEYTRIWDYWYSSYTCDSNFTASFNYTKPVIAGCNDDEFFLCSYGLPDSYYVFYYLTNYQYYYGTYNASEFCGKWSTFLSCISKTGCSFDDIQRITEMARNTSYSYYYYYADFYVGHYRQLYNATFETSFYMCGEGRESIDGRCVSYSYNCERAMQMKMSYPYGQWIGICSARFEDGICSYQTYLSTCNQSSAVASLKLRMKFNELWLFYSYGYYWHSWDGQSTGSTKCAFNFTDVMKAPTLNDTACSRNNYFRCVDQSSLWSYMFQPYGNTLTNLLAGYSIESWMSQYCGYWEGLVDCVNCSSTIESLGDIEFVEAYIRYNYWYYNEELKNEQRRYLLNEALTPNRLQLLCYTDRQAVANYQQCFRENATSWNGGFYNAFYSCKSEALMTVANGTADDGCSLYEIWFRCLYLKIIERCSAASGAFVMEYFLSEWTKYLLENKNCLLDMRRIVPSCDEGACVTQLVSTVNASVSLLTNGQLTASHLASLCSAAQSSSRCVTTVVAMGCNITNDVSKYTSLADDVAPYLCHDIRRRDYLSSQPCYAQHSASSASVLHQLLTNYSCPGSRQWLFSLFNVVNSSCGSQAAGDVTGLAAQFHAVLDLSSTNTRLCQNLLHPTENAIAAFEGPFFVNETSGGSEGSCTNYYFLCRVNYPRQATDDGARFDVSLIFDGQLATAFKTTTSLQLDVRFTEDDLIGHFGTTVSCAVRSYWLQMPTVKTDFVWSTGSYFVGIKHWTDVYRRNAVQISESAKSTPIYFQATVPITCPNCTVTVQLSRHTGLIVSSCSLTFSSTDEPRAIKAVNIRAVQTPGSNSRFVAINFNTSTTCSGSPWSTYQVADIPVLIVDHVWSRSCASDGDPHIRTFDYRFYSVYFSGDFLLWKSYGDEVPVEVHVRFQHCMLQTVSCNCAVAFREGNNVVGVYACDANKPPIAIEYLRDPSTPAPSVKISNGGLYFYITMPSGRSMSVSTWCKTCGRLSITIYAISADEGQSEGLCGNYNGLWDDDTIPRGSTIRDENYYEPVMFARSYMLSASASLINGHIYFPECISTNESLPVQCQCGQTDPGNCESVSSATGSMDSAVKFSTYGTDRCNRRRKREIEDLGPYVITPEELPPQDPGTPPNAPIHGNGTTDNGVAEDEARRMCEQPLLESPIYKQCAVFTASVKETIINSCVLDVQLTGSARDIVDGILAKYSQACVRGVQESDNRTVEDAVQRHNETGRADSDLGSILQTPESAAILSALTSQICPGQPECSGNGTCSNATCSCNTGYVGSDCSLLADVPPTITGLRFNSSCDVRDNRNNNNERCRRVALLVSGESLSSTFACKAVTTSGTYYTNVKTVTVGEIEFRLPITPLDDQSTSASYSWTVSVSNDNVTFSNEIQLFVYDSKCLVCPQATPPCQQEADSCLIDGKCYSSDELNPTDSCSKCSPPLSNSDWTPESSDECNKRTTETTTGTTPTTTPVTVTSKPSVDTETTVAGVLMTWSSWSTWTECDNGCSGSVSRRTRTCVNGNSCVGVDVELLNCLMDKCEAVPAENSEGFVIKTPMNQISQLSNGSFLVHFFEVMVNIVNNYCTENKQACCSQLLQLSKVNPVSGKLVVAIRSATNIARGFPRTSGSNEKSIKVLMKSTRSLLKSQCLVPDGSRGRRQSDDSEVYLNKDVVTTAISSSITTLQTETGMTILSVAVSSETDKGGAGWTIRSNSILITIVLMCLTLIRHHWHH